MMRVPYSVWRLLTALMLMAVGSGAMYVVAVVLPEVQAEFGVARADASLPYTLTMLGFGFGGIMMGRLADRFGITVPLLIGTCGLVSGYLLAAMAANLWMFTAVHGLLLGLLGSSATFAPLVADTSLWFNKRRGIAVAICASGNYLAGALWPPIVQHFTSAHGWRATYVGMAAVCLVVMLPLALLLRRRPPALATAGSAQPASRDAPARPVASSVIAPGSGTLDTARPLGMAPNMLQFLLVIAGIACCVAMSMPQVHIVAYCTDLGFGPARGAQMLSLMLGFGIVSRLASGMICDRIGGLRTLLLGSVLQMAALILFVPFDSLASLYAISIIFGLFQGGIVPSYAIIVREYFSPMQAGTRVAWALTATLLGMALGGWLTGKIFDLTGSYDAAFLHGIGWNLVNVSIVLFLLHRANRAGLLVPLRSRPAAGASGLSVARTG